MNKNTDSLEEELENFLMSADDASTLKTLNDLLCTIN